MVVACIGYVIGLIYCFILYLYMVDTVKSVNFLAAVIFFTCEYPVVIQYCLLNKRFTQGAEFNVL